MSSQALLSMRPDAPAQSPHDQALLREFPASELPHLAVRGVLGEGGMATVYEAEHERLALPVAVKLLRVEDARAEEARGRMLREARLYAGLGDPRIPRVYDVDVLSDGRVYVVLELVQGQPLDAWLRDGRALPPALAVHVARELCASLAHLHDAGILHRDVKPSNILLDVHTSPAKVWLIDLGIAKAREARGGDVQLTLQGTVIGTPHYMAPERIMGGDADVRSDVYSVGVLLYELLTGCSAFPGSTDAQVVAAVLRDGPPDVRHHAPEVSSELAALVQRAVARDPGRRFPSAQAMADALAAVGEAQPEPRPRSHAPVLLADDTRPARRQCIEPGKALAWAAAGLVLAMGISWWRDDGEVRGTAKPAAITAPARVVRRTEAERTLPASAEQPATGGGADEVAQTAPSEARSPASPVPARRAEKSMAPSLTTLAAPRPTSATAPRPEVQQLGPAVSPLGRAAEGKGSAIERRVRTNPYAE
jgi:eukaryotic-like serine/threonine-protein kinase